MKQIHEPDVINDFLEKNGKAEWTSFIEMPWRDFDVYSLIPRIDSRYPNNTEPDFPQFLLCPTMMSQSFYRFRIFEDRNLILTHYLKRISDNEDIEGLSINQMFCNSHFVSHIDSIGRKFFPDWNLNAFLCGKMGPGEYCPDFDMALIDYADIDGLELNGPGGIQWGYELFLRPRKYWPLRGAPFFWCELARKLTDYELPLSDSDIDEAVREMKYRYGIPKEGERPVCVPNYVVEVHSGMSSGMVSPDGINEMADDIKQRNKFFAEAPIRFLNEYVMRFENFPFVY